MKTKMSAPMKKKVKVILTLVSGKEEISYIDKNVVDEFIEMLKNRQDYCCSTIYY